MNRRGGRRRIDHRSAPRHSQHLESVLLVDGRVKRQLMVPLRSLVESGREVKQPSLETISAARVKSNGSMKTSTREGMEARLDAPDTSGTTAWSPCPRSCG